MSRLESAQLRCGILVIALSGTAQPMTVSGKIAEIKQGEGEVLRSGEFALAVSPIHQARRTVCIANMAKVAASARFGLMRGQVQHGWPVSPVGEYPQDRHPEAIRLAIQNQSGAFVQPVQSLIHEW
ncbi:hypothetical protein [Parerythrobacter lacustris]|uniref:Uncharacterized protein n=1 Tax=Parerythrobacter lacustris TaxID=2969984 RepID=A0ABT1XUT1_9SPHN|nr:hypothetical protein [Parerythrobacter lacustris]MCR2834197.1 hypothetical protein [Parerythrobacter lacustris]